MPHPDWLMSPPDPGTQLLVGDGDTQYHTSFSCSRHHYRRHCDAVGPLLCSLPCLALPCLALPCLALPCLALPCLALPCVALRCLVLSHPFLTSLCCAGCRVVHSWKKACHKCGARAAEGGTEEGVPRIVLPALRLLPAERSWADLAAHLGQGAYFARSPSATKQQHHYERRPCRRRQYQQQHRR